MQITLLRQKILTGIPSASGIECVGEKVYVMGDDSPWLFRLDDKYAIAEKIKLTDAPYTSDHRIPKSLKPDLEAMTSIRLGKNTELLLFGSGSKSPERDVLLKINTAHPHILKKYSLVRFYESLRKTTGLSKDELNIEAAVASGKYLYLFNRGKNTVIRLSLNDFLSYVEGIGKVPGLELFHVILPALEGIEAGFSGATSTPDLQQIIFTASVENTPNWVDDGEILGSFVGIFPIQLLKDSFSPDCIALTDVKNNILKIKVESVAVQCLVSPNNFKLLLVTDNDGTTSELIEAELNC